MNHMVYVFQSSTLKKVVKRKMYVNVITQKIRQIYYHNPQNSLENQLLTYISM